MCVCVCVCVFVKDYQSSPFHNFFHVSNLDSKLSLLWMLECLHDWKKGALN